MNDVPAWRTNAESAQRFQHKFEFYAVALTFTILGLSIQTADFGAVRLADALELESPRVYRRLFELSLAGSD